MVEISARLLHRIQLDFPHHADLVLNRLSALDGLVTQSRQDAERMLAAVVRCAAGRLDHLDRALALARLDWRDLLVAADLADEAWPARLSEWLDPGTRPDTASPGTRGELADGDGRRWQVRRRRLDLRIVKRLIRRPEVVVMLGESGGFSLRVVAAGGRDQLWETVRHAYAGPGGPQPVTGGIDYMGYEFTRADGDDDTVMLYLEQRC